MFQSQSSFGNNKYLVQRTESKSCTGRFKKVVAAFGTSWKRCRNLEAAQVQEQPGKKVKKLASVSLSLS